MITKTITKTFTESIASTLTLTIKGTPHKVPGGNIKHCEITLQEHGFQGEIEFWLSGEVSDDKLLKDFTGDSPIQLELSLQQHTFSEAKPGEPITLKGMVGERWVLEAQYLEVQGSPVLYRRYRCQFCDPAQFIWQQHFPSELYVDKTLKQVIQAQVLKPISLKLDWAHLDETQPMICIGLGAIEVSFYRFLRNYLAQYGGYLLYDYQKHEYQIVSAKPKPEATVKLAPEQIEEVQMGYSSPDLKSINLLNAHAGLAATESVTENKNLPGVKQDRLIITPLKQVVKQHKQRETQYGEARKPALQVALAKWPLQPITPGVEIQLKHPLYNSDALSVQKGQRTHTSVISLHAMPPEPQQDLHMDFTQYQCRYQHWAESLEEKHWPRIKSCLQPFLVQGEIVSEPGEDTDKTYQYQENDETKQRFYRIKINLWDLEIKVLFQPDFLPAHFYFPLYKGTVVELQMQLFEARITRVLDWGARVFLEQDTQGNHLILGKNDKDETAIRYVYEDNLPVFSIKRIKEKDTELLQFEDGKIIFRTQELD